MIRKLLLFFSILLVVGAAQSQDIHFSQYYASPLTLNPALTGNMDHSQRVILNYRSQWASILGEDAYNTLSVSYDQQFERNNGDYFGIGGAVYADIAGEAKLTTLFGGISGSYSKLLAGDQNSAHYLTAGVGLGFGQRALNTANLRWASQFDASGFNPGIGGGVIDSDSKTFLDVSGGLTYLFAFNRRSNIHIGASAYHLNEPEVSFLGTNSSLNQKIAIHGGAEIEVLDQFYILPSALYLMQGESTMILGGLAGRLYFEQNSSSNQSLDIGLYSRFVENLLPDDTNTMFTKTSDLESFIMMIRLTYENVGIGLSYDFNVSDLKAVTRSQGAFEATIQFYIDKGPTRGAKGLRF